MSDIAKSDDKIQQLLARARHFYYAGEYQEAIELLSQVLLIDPNNREARDRLEQSEDSLRRGFVPDSRVPFEARVAFGRAQSLERAGRYEEARKGYQLALEEARKGGELLKNWQPAVESLARIENAIVAQETRKEADALMQQDMWPEAIRKYEAILKLIPEDSHARQYIELLSRVQEEVTPLEAALRDATIRWYPSSKVAEIASKLVELSQRFPYLSYSPRLYKLLDEAEHLLTKLREYEHLLEASRRELETANYKDSIALLEQAKEIFPSRSMEVEPLLAEAHKKLALSQEYYALLGRGRELLDKEDYKPAADILCQASRLIEEAPEIVEPSRRRITRHLCNEAQEKLRAVEEMQQGIYDAELALQKGDCCTAVDILIKVLKVDLQGNRANEIREKASKLRVSATILCAEKIASEGGFTRAKSILEPYSENTMVSKAIEKVTARQNSEAEARKRQRNEYLEELKAQSEIWFKWAVRASILGAILLLAGAVGAFIGQVQASVVAAISSILPSAFAKFFIDQYRELRAQRLAMLTKTTREEELEIEAQRQAMGLNQKEKEK